MCKKSIPQNGLGYSQRLVRDHLRKLWLSSYLQFKQTKSSTVGNLVLTLIYSRAELHASIQYLPQKSFPYIVP